MTTDYEIIRYKQGLNARVIVHNVDRFKLHWHKEMELLLILKGQVQVSINGKKYLLKEDDLFLINSGEIHSTAGNSDNITAAIQIDPGFCLKAYPHLQDIQFEFGGCALSDSSTELSKNIRAFIAQIINEYNKASEGYQLVIEGVLNVLMACLVRNIPQVSEKKSLRVARDKEFTRITEILDFIDEHFTEKISLESLAQSFFLSTSYLSHFFKSKVGLTFQEYLSHVRLRQAVRQIEQTNALIGDISLDCGFASVKAFNKAFRDFYALTPGEYRRVQMNPLADVGENSAYLKFDTLQAMTKLQTYIFTPYFTQAQSQTGSSAQNPLRFDSRCKPLGTWRHSWQRIGSIGRAHDLLRADLYGQVCEAVHLLSFKLLRFHGIFSDEMHVVTRNTQNELIFNFMYTDKILDLLLEMGLRPMFDLTFMPAALASGSQSIFNYCGNITPPAHLNEWVLLIDRFARHCISRYGVHEVRQWYFEVWNEPDYFWAGTAEQYYDFYDATAEALRSVDNRLLVGGPSILYPLNNAKPWLRGFIDHLNKKHSPMDFFTFHVYGEKQHILDASGHVFFRTGGADHLTDVLTAYRAELDRLHTPVREVFITEYNASSEHGNYLLDTMFPACQILHDALKTDNLLNGIAVWTLSDIFEENAYPTPAFNGGFGMVTPQGIHKPSWHALRFLSLLGDEIMARGEEYIITRKNDTYQMLFFRYAHYDRMYANGDRSLLSYHNRYNVFEDKPPLRLALRVEGLHGKYRITQQQLDRTHGSAWDLYVKMGAPRDMTPEQGKWLKNAAQPELFVQTETLSGEWECSFELEAHGIRFITLEPVIE